MRVLFSLIIILLFLSCGAVFAQDIITTQNGKEIRAKVTVVNQSKIIYIRSGIMDTLNRADVVMIKYKGGRMEYFTERTALMDSTIRHTASVNAVADSTHNDMKISPEDSAHNALMAERGKADAKLFYKKYKTAASWTSVTTWLLTPAAGLIPAISCSVTPPKEKNLNCPYPDLLHDPAYHTAYVQKAHSIKAGKTWIGYGIGAGICAAIAAFVLTFIK